MRRILHSLILLALVALPASAATLKLRDGSTIECKVTSFDADSKTLHVRLANGKDASYTMDQFDARSVYLVNASLIPEGDPKAQLLAANFAREAGLYAHAARRYGIAAKLDPSLKSTVDAEMVKLRRAAATACMARAREEYAKKDISEAERYLKILVDKLPDEPEAAQARTYLDQYYGQQREKKIAAVDATADAALQKDVEEGKKRYAEMVENSKKGLQASGSQSESYFRKALADGKAVLSEIDAIGKKYTDSKTQEQVASYRSTVTDQMIEVHLSIASKLATQTDYKGAQKEVGSALALDPKNAEALAMRARIEEYASNGWGWGWGGGAVVVSGRR